VSEAQPNATRMSTALLQALVDRLSPGTELPESSIEHRFEHSNDFAQIRIEPGRTLVVKRPRFEWAASRFATSRIASTMIREHAQLTVPRPLPLPSYLDPMPLEAYWRIEKPVLKEVWSGLDAARRREGLRSLGGMLARLHGVRTVGFGPLSDAATPSRTLSDYLRTELLDRLLPATAADWPGAMPVVEALAERIDEMEERVGDRSRLVHNDLHMGNILCDAPPAPVSCLGLIDLETAVSAPPESDLASLEVHHGPLFGQPIEGAWMQTVRSAYPSPADARAINFYRAFHLVNMGFYSALVGHDWHAARVLEAAAGEVDRLRKSPVPLAAC
jgi:aminoglycoside phosphotransferase (APT) family kinase protein